MTTMMEWALFYKQQGMSIIPVKGKVPLIPWKEYQERCASEEEIKTWWKEWAEADIGMVTGNITKRIVLDIDSNKGYDNCKRNGLPNTPTVKTNRGLQLHFKNNGSFSSKTTVAGLLSDVDVRGEGGYVKLPPSRFSDESGRYEWINDFNTPLAECPQWLIDLLNKPKENIERKESGWIAEVLENLTDGTKHNQIVSVLGRLRHDNYAMEDAFAFIIPYAKEKGISEKDIWERIESVWGLYPSKAIPSNETQNITEFLADEQKVEWLVPGIIAKGSLGFVAGIQETGKTWMLIDLAIEMAKGGGMWLGKFPTKKAKVWFIDQERHKSETQRRFKSVITAKNINSSGLESYLTVASGTTIRINLQQSFDAFKNKLNELKPDIIMIDSFATFHTAPENDRTEIQKVLEKIKELRNEFGCTFLFINHEGKSILHHEPGEIKDPHSADMMGSVAVPAAAELVVTVRRKDNESCMVYHTKSTLGPKISPFTLTIKDLNEERTKIAIQGY